MNVAVARRIRHFDLHDRRLKDGSIETAEKQAMDPRRGYALGVLFLQGNITEPQFLAGVRYAEDMARYYGLTGVPFPSARAQNLFAIGRDEGEDSHDRADAAKKAKARMVKLRDILLAVGDINTGRRIWQTVMTIVVTDEADSRKWPPHMVEHLRRGLNALVRYYGVGEAAQ